MYKYFFQLLFVRRAIIISALTLCIICSSIYSTAQNTPSTKKLHPLIEYAEQVLGSDSRLVAGTIYQNKYYNAKGTPYFMGSEWLTGTIYVKGIPFKNTDFKYNLQSDKIILKVQSDDGNTKHLVLNDHFVDSVEIAHIKLLNARLTNSLTLKGYFELICNGKTQAYRKHRIRLKETLTSDSKKLKFLPQDPILYLVRDGISKPIYGKKDLLNYFYPIKKEVKKYMTEQKINLKTASKIQLFSLIKYCDEIS